MPARKVRDVIKLVEQDGWYLVRTVGSHRQYHHASKIGTVTIAGHPGQEHETWHLQQHSQASRTEVMRFAVVFEKTDNGWSAYAPDLPGLGVAAKTLDETKQLLREAIELHIDDLRSTGQPIPAAASRADYVEIPIPA